MSKLKVLAAVLGVISGLNFSLFIIEEGLQVLMFSSWAGKNLSKETRQMIVDAYASANLALKALNWCIGIFIPPMFVAYALYAKNGDIWIRAQVEAHGLRPPFPDLLWVQYAMYSCFAFIALVVLVLVIRRVAVPRAAANSLNIAQLREKQ